MGKRRPALQKISTRWATRNNIAPFDLLEAGSYVEVAQIASDGVNLGKD